MTEFRHTDYVLGNRTAQQSPLPRTALRPEELEQALTAAPYRWRPESARWAAENVPVRLVDEPAGRFFGGQPPDVGYVAVDGRAYPQPRDRLLEHEVHHAWDYSDQDGAWGYDEPGIRRDMAALAQREADYPQAARAARRILGASNDPVHFNHDLADQLYFDWEQVPRDYLRQRFGYATVPSGPERPRNYRSFLPGIAQRWPR